MRPAARGVLRGEPGRLEVPKLHCRGCGKPVPPGRRNWCGQACIDEQLVRNNPAHARQKVLERDREVCGGCGRDTAALAVKLGAWLACDWSFDATTSGRGQVEHLMGERFRVAERRRKFAERFGVKLVGHWAQMPAVVGGHPCFGLRHLWEADHIVPVVEGGGGCGLDNLRTLCRPCHRRETRALASRRAESRRRAKEKS